MKFMLHYTLPNVWKIGPIRFLPGINEVEESNWNKVKDHPLLQERFDSGALVWVKGPKDEVKKAKAEALPPVEDDGDALAGTTVEEAKKLVTDTFDLNLLKKWSETETRKSVLKAIEAQVDKVTPKDDDFRGGDGDNT